MFETLVDKKTLFSRFVKDRANDALVVFFKLIQGMLASGADTVPQLCRKLMDNAILEEICDVFVKNAQRTQLIVIDWT